MDFSGYSTDLVLAGPARVGQLFSRFSVSLQEKWPTHLVNGENSRSFDFRSTSPDVARNDSEPDIATFSRDHQMEEFWEERGYSLDATGEGPIAIFYKPFKRFLLQVDCGIELGSHASWQGAIAAIPDGFHLSLVTPGDPSGDAFSGWAKNCLIRALWDAPPTAGGSS
ncbi:hypothetical protein ACIPYR_34410 [Streptomyces parvus]|uniref:hypothetical protein n=1 Tax=Streptomyces TaxID=1883 RepID=UPI0033DDA65E